MFTAILSGIMAAISVANTIMDGVGSQKASQRAAKLSKALSTLQKAIQAKNAVDNRDIAKYNNIIASLQLTAQTIDSRLADKVRGELSRAQDIVTKKTADVEARTNEYNEQATAAAGVSNPGGMAGLSDKAGVESLANKIEQKASSI